MSNIQLYFSGDQYFRSILKDIRNALSSVEIEAYIFNFDMVGLELWNEIEEAQKRGVKIRILVDGIGSINSITDLHQRASKSQISVKVYHPIALKLSWLMFNNLNKIRRLLLLFKFNKRNHRKIVFIDSKILYLGSFNFTQVHSEKVSGTKAWRDTGVKLIFKESDPEVTFMKRIMSLAWAQKRRPLKPHTKLNSGSIRSNHSIRQRVILNRDLIKKINGATERVLITNAYFIPRQKLIRALKNAARRGVYVAICLPAKNDIWLIQVASKTLYSRLLRAGIYIFEYEPRMLHAKTVIIDNWSSVGSHNLNHRSLMHDLEIEYAVTRPDLNAQMLKQWDEDLKWSRTMTLHEVENRNWLLKAVGAIIFWFRYWL
jgi:cardiolipin synthase A/B